MLYRTCTCYSRLPEDEPLGSKLVHVEDIVKIKLNLTEMHFVFLHHTIILSWGPPSLLYNGYRVFPGGKSAGGVVLTIHPHLQCRGFKKGTVIPLPTIRALVAYKWRAFTFLLYDSRLAASVV